MKFFVSILFTIALAVFATGFPVEESEQTELLQLETEKPINRIEAVKDSLNDKQPQHSREKREPRKRKRFDSNVDVQHSRQGTDLSASVGGQIWQSQNGRSEVNGNANYNRHFGGPSGSSRPNYGAGVQFRHRF